MCCKLWARPSRAFETWRLIPIFNAERLRPATGALPDAVIERAYIVETSQKDPIDRGERRSANRYAVAMRVEIWPECEKRGSGTEFARTRDISMHGVFFISAIEHAIGKKVNFSVLFLHQPSGSEADLITGLGRIVRCEPLVAVQELHFGIAIEIEKTTHIYEG